MDDGSDQDYDSHIMVWQLPKVAGDAIKKALEGTALAAEQLSNPVRVQAAVSQTTSRASSSLDLGLPTPGSGVVTADSENDDNGGGEGLPDSFEPLDPPTAADSYTNWNKDVQSLLNNVKESLDDEDNATVCSSSTVETGPAAPSPREDFTGQLRGQTPAVDVDETAEEA